HFRLVVLLPPFPDVFHKSGSILFCTACNIVVEHERKWPLHRHFSTTKHAKRTAETGRGKTRQDPMTEAVGSRTTAGAERVKVSADLLYKAIEEKKKEPVEASCFVKNHCFLVLFKAKNSKKTVLGHLQMPMFL
uniref:Uncharacterized protein n=1 Tax=Sphaeramia orbicularis TaxID=375764 RepID=A0A673CL06_9TELE